jgi:hypothetical protein
MQELALEKIRDGREPDVRMRAHVEPLAGRKRDGAHRVEEHERTDAAPRLRKTITASSIMSMMPPTSALGDIAHVIQLAIAPVFLLTAVGTLLNVLVNRLGRSVDRRRSLVAALPGLDAAIAATAQGELKYVQRRVRLIYTAILLAVVAALLICLLIAIAFLDALIVADLSQLVAVLFVLAMVALIGSLALFLREIYLGVNTVASPFH